METIGGGFYWQDMTVGRSFKTRGRTITETDLSGFVSLSWLNEQLFTNSEYMAAQEAYTGQLAPGGMLYLFAEGLAAPTMEGTGMAFLGMELEVKGPSYVGDTVHLEIEVIEQRAASKGNRGLVRTRNSVINQKGETVLVYTPLRMMRGRPEE